MEESAKKEQGRKKGKKERRVRLEEKKRWGKGRKREKKRKS